MRDGEEDDDDDDDEGVQYSVRMTEKGKMIMGSGSEGRVVWVAWAR